MLQCYGVKWEKHPEEAFGRSIWEMFTLLKWLFNIVLCIAVLEAAFQLCWFFRNGPKSSFYNVSYEMQYRAHLELNCPASWRGQIRLWRQTSPHWPIVMRCSQGWFINVTHWMLCALMLPSFLTRNLISWSLYPRKGPKLDQRVSC